ncbi:MAG: hypothetical protein ACI9HU_000635 [Colwellia sp.]|jgi:hypothetical protein
MTRKSFVLHVDSLDVLDELTNEQAGMLLKAMHSFHVGNEIELDTLTKIIFSPFKNQFFRDNEKYIKTCEKRAESGSIGGRSSRRESGIDNHGANQLYVIRLYNESEDFIKIGTTTNRINRRFSGAKNMPYEYEIVHQLIGVDSWLETSLQTSLAEFTYVPSIRFPGHTECFSRDCLDKLIKLKAFAQAKCSKAHQKAAKLAENDNVSKNDSDNVNDSDSDNKSVSKQIKDLPTIVEEYVFKLPTNKIDSFYLVTSDEINNYKFTYQAVDVEQQYRQILAWLTTNQANRKTKSGMPRFINAWLSKSQNNAPRANTSSAIGKTQEIFNQLSEINYDKR